MNLVLPVNKPIGLTSYDVIRDLKKKYPGEVIGHAGTLDPLADGILICLVGKEATVRQQEFMNVDKDYEFDVLFGVSTDTYDILGLIQNSNEYDCDGADQKVRGIIGNYNGIIQQPVPPFSAIKIKGKPLYRWYLDGKISEVEIPIKEVEIKKIEILSKSIISKDQLKSRVFELLEHVDSGFRKQKVIADWEGYFQNTKQEFFLIERIRTTVSKGTYVRAIAHDVGEKIGVPACTITITRTRVGDFKL